MLMLVNLTLLPGSVCVYACMLTKVRGWDHWLVIDMRLGIGNMKAHSLFQYISSCFYPICIFILLNIVFVILTFFIPPFSIVLGQICC